jgi:pyruvate kinase
MTKRHDTRTRIVATIGPASNDPAMLRELVIAGVDVFRFNMSHGTHRQKAKVFAALRRISRKA